MWISRFIAVLYSNKIRLFIFLNKSLLLKNVTQMYYFFYNMVVSIFSAHTTTCRNQYVFSGKYKKKEPVHLPISTARAPTCKKEGRNIVFLRRKGIRTDPDISKCKTPAAAFQLLTSIDFDSAPRAHYLRMLTIADIAKISPVRDFPEGCLSS